MNTLAVAMSCAALAAGGGTTMTGRTAPDLIVKEWPTGPEVHLRNVRGRKALLLFYHTDC
ncbi:MAG: hypothetical protein ACYS9X_09645 [Planctomycetota bacterium]|jgi:hypothetical protein